MRQEPYIDIDVHGMTSEQAIEKIESIIKKANSSTYRIRIVHGFNRGNSIQRAIYRELVYWKANSTLTLLQIISMIIHTNHTKWRKDHEHT